MKINYYKDCIDCNGTGSREIFQPFYNSKMKVECNTCHGKGIVKFDLDENTIKVEKVREMLSQWSREVILYIEGLDDIYNIINENVVLKNYDTINERKYSKEEIMLYAKHWLKRGLCGDGLNNITVNERLSAFMHYFDKKNDSDNIENFLKNKVNMK